MFAGLFIVHRRDPKNGARNTIWRPSPGASIWTMHSCSAESRQCSSNMVSNVPAVLVFKPLVAHLKDPRRAWLVLAMSSTLAGNLTVVGSVANLIVIQQAGRVKIGFWEYFRVGAPLAVVTILMGAAWIAWRGY